MNNLKVIKAGKSQYGHYLQLDNHSYVGASQKVSNYLKDQCPCEIQILESEGEGKSEVITQVKVISSSKPKADGDFRLNVDAGNMVRMATDLVIADKFKDLTEATLTVCAVFRMAQIELSKPVEIQE